MTPRSKYRFIFICVAAIIFWIIVFRTSPSTPEQEFKSLFSELAIGVPEYQTFYRFTQPPDAIQQDFFALDLGQSDTQLHQFATKLGVPITDLLSSNGVSITAKSKINPKYPWMLWITVQATNEPKKIYKLHIDGKQPYN